MSGAWECSLCSQPAVAPFREPICIDGEELCGSCGVSYPLHQRIAELEAQNATLRRDLGGDTFSADYLAGWAKGVTDYAVWSDGEQFVGVRHKPLREVLAKGPSRRTEGER